MANRRKRTTKRQRKAARHLAAVMWRDTLHGRISAYRDEAAAVEVVGKFAATVTLAGDAAGFEREILERYGHHE